MQKSQSLQELKKNINANKVTDLLEKNSENFTERKHNKDTEYIVLFMPY